MKCSIAVVIAALASSSAPAASQPPPLRQGCDKRAEIVKRLKGYSRESSTALDVGIVKEKWTTKEDTVDVTVMPDGSACVWRVLPLHAPRFYRSP